MKRRALLASVALVLACLVSVAVPAQAQQVQIERSTATKHALTPPVRDYVNPPAPQGFLTEIPIRLVPATGGEGRGSDPNFVQLDEFPVAGASLTPPTILNFKAQPNVNGVLPPDTNGAVGTTQYLQWNNLSFAVYNKANGAVIQGSTNGNAFFQGLGSPCATTNNGDPMVTFDQRNNRWVVSQFAINQGKQCVAVSTTADATGSYNAYEFTVGGANDYPKQGLWLNDTRDVFSLTYRTFGGPGGGISLDFQVIDYPVMVAGGPSPGSAIVRGGLLGGGQKPPGFQEGTLPADVNGDTYAPTDAAIFGRFEGGAAANEFFLWEFDGNFPGGTPSFTFLPSESISTIDRNVGQIPQPSGPGLDDHSFFTMSTLAYRNRGGFQQLLATSTVDVGGDRAGKHFAEFRKSGATWSTFQQASYGPAAPLERWMGGINSDANGNILLCYSVSSSGLNPSIRCTSRTPSDPLNTLPGGEVTVQTGGGSQLHSAARWGDYMTLTVDPSDDCTLWGSTEYLESTGSAPWVTRIWSMRFAGCGTPQPTPTITQTGGSCPGTLNISGTNFTPTNEIAILESANTNGWTKGGTFCNGAQFEIGEPFLLPPNWVFSNASGDFATSIPTQSGFCNIEALDYRATCQTSNVIAADAPTGIISDGK